MSKRIVTTRENKIVLNISNNLILFYDPLLPGGTKNYGIAFHQGADRINNVMGMPQNIIFQHNTMISAASTPCATGVYFGDSTSFPPAPHVTSNVWILDNVMCRQPSGDGGYNGTSGLTKYMGYPSTPPYDLTQRFYGNVMYVPSGDTVRTFPPHNYATTVPLTYVNPAAFNYQLLTPYWTDTRNGMLAGIDYVALSPAIGAGAQIPTRVTTQNNLTGVNAAAPSPPTVLLKPGPSATDD